MNSRTFKRVVLPRPPYMEPLDAAILPINNAGLPLTNSRTYYAAFTDDAHFAVEEIQRRFPDAPLFAAGYSLGSLILTKYLAEADTGKWVGEGTQDLQHHKMLAEQIGHASATLCYLGASQPALPSCVQLTLLLHGSSKSIHAQRYLLMATGPMEQTLLGGDPDVAQFCLLCRGL